MPYPRTLQKNNNIIDMIQEFQIRVLPVVASSEQNIIRYIADEKGIDARTVNAVRVLKRSIDARQRTIFINLTVRVYINEIPQDAEFVHTEYGDVSRKPLRSDSSNLACAPSCLSVAKTYASARWTSPISLRHRL